MQYKTNVKKFLIASTIIVGLFIVVALSYSRAKNFPTQQPHNNLNQTTDQTTVDQLQTTVEMVDSKEGVDVSVDEIKRKNGQTILSLGINNHVEDYSQVDLKERSELAGVKPIKYTVDNTVSGGHHVSSELIFDGNLSGLLVVRLTDELVFNITVK